MKHRCLSDDIRGNKHEFCFVLLETKKQEGEGMEAQLQDRSSTLLHARTAARDLFSSRRNPPKESFEKESCFQIEK
jgi:hypothetical protein